MTSVLDFIVNLFSDFISWTDTLSFGSGNGTMFTFLIAAGVIALLISLIFRG